VFVIKGGVAFRDGCIKDFFDRHDERMERKEGIVLDVVILVIKHVCG